MTHIRKRSWDCGLKMWLAKGPGTASWIAWKMEYYCASEWMDATLGVFLLFFLKKELSSNLSLALSFCRLINALQPGSVKKINHSSQNWHQVMLQLSKLRPVFHTEWNLVCLPHWQQRLLFTFHKVASISNEAHLSTAFISLVLDQEKANRALKRWLKRLSESSRCDIDTAAHAHRPSHSRTLQGHGRKSRESIFSKSYWAWILILGAKVSWLPTSCSLSSDMRSQKKANKIISETAELLVLQDGNRHRFFCCYARFYSRKKNTGSTHSL